MLAFLKVENLALIESLEVEFSAGFTCLTGETGAGKSVLMGALSLLAGARGNKTLVRRGAEDCTVQASLFFEEPATIDSLLQEMELPATDSGNLNLYRRFALNKPQRIQINGTLATLAQLETIGQHWLELHDPDEPRRLFEPSRQLELVDASARHPQLLEDYATAWQAWQEILSEIGVLEQESSLSPDEADFLQRQVDELRALDLSDDGLALLESRFQRATHAREIGELASALTDSIEGDGGALNGLARAAALLRQLHKLDPGGAEAHLQRMETLVIEAGDLARDLAGVYADTALEPAEVAAIEQEMAQWLTLKRRHGGSPTAVREKLASMEKRIEARGDLEGTLTRLRKAAADKEKAARQVAEKLHQSRQKAAAQLAKKVTGLLLRLGFKKPSFLIELQPLPAMRADGGSAATFLFSGTAGQPALPLNRIASSGEAARVALALKTALVEADRSAVLVFDEIDANVGGEVGREIGRELARLAGTNQVFAITHLPQVASLAGHHFCIEKQQDKDHAEILLRRVEGHSEERIAEIARMLGDRHSATARQHALELIGAKGC